MITVDPRPDLAYDSQAWTMLLTMAAAKNPVLASNLHGLRCCGLRLHRGAKGYALIPDLDPVTSAWNSKEQYLADRDLWLMPYANQIMELLEWLNKKEVA